MDIFLIEVSGPSRSVARYAYYMSLVHKVRLCFAKRKSAFEKLRHGVENQLGKG